MLPAVVESVAAMLMPYPVVAEEAEKSGARYMSCPAVPPVPTSDERDKSPDVAPVIPVDVGPVMLSPVPLEREEAVIACAVWVVAVVV